MKPKYKINKQYLIIEYNKKLKTIFEIANQIGCNSWVIKNRMKKYNIKIRKHGGTKKLRGTYKKENNPAWKGGKPKCKCGKALSTNRTRQCHSCKWLAEKNPNFKSGKPKCIDCNKIIAYPSKRCSQLDRFYSFKRYNKTS